MRLNFAGFAIEVDIDPGRASQVQKSALYRRLAKPMLDRRAREAAAREIAPLLAPAREPPDLRDPDAASIWEQISNVHWYQAIDLGHGVTTPGFIDHRPIMHLSGLPEDMAGMRALDIGTFDGFWAFEMERRGAAEVVGIDLDSPLDYDLPRPRKQQLQREAVEGNVRERLNSDLANLSLQLPGEGFRVAKSVLNSKAKRIALNVYALSPQSLGTFDVVFIGDLLLHLRDPQKVIENIFSVTRQIAIVAEPFREDLELFDRALSEFVGMDHLQSWWLHSIKSFRKMLEVAGFDRIEEVGRFPFANRLGTFSKVVLKGHVPQASAG